MSAPAVPLVEPSPVEAAREAFDHTRRILFPFHFERWLTLGLVAFLDQCGRGGMGGAVPGGPTGLPSGGTGDGDLSQVGSWFTAHLAVIVLVAVVAFVVLMALIAAATWIGSRAAFVYIDDVATGRAELTRPWRVHAERANSYFAWRFGLAAALLIALALLVLMAVLAVFAIARGGGAGAVLGAVLLIVLVPAFIAVLLAGGLGAVALRDFVAPLQIHLQVGCRPAVRVFVELVRAYPLPFLLYVVLKIVFEVVRGAVLVVAACLTLCCVLLPVVTQTALQPLFFFERAWSLYLLRQMGYDLIGGTMAGGPMDVPAGGPALEDEVP
jgi:hypothetical protein